MLLWASLLVLALISGRFATLPRPVISLQPPWSPVFEGETVLLTCNVSDLNTPGKITWYYKNRKHEATGNTISVNLPGEYQCQIQNSATSKPVNLEFPKAPLILQAPVSVFQGDSVVLRCQTNVDVVLGNLKIYKNRKMLTALNTSTKFHIHQASLKDNGEYICKGVKGSGTRVSSNTVKIQVEELFPPPVLTSRYSQLTEGTLVTLTCEVQLPPQRSDTQLQFRFFRDGQVLGSGWSHSPEFQISEVWKTGSYSCNAKTVTSNVSKQSRGVQIHVRIPVSRPVLTLSSPGAQALEGDIISLYCKAHKGTPNILYKFYHEGVVLKRNSKSDGEGASFVLPLTTKNSGKYYCTAENGFGAQPSEAVSILVTIPVSHPVLTLRAPRAQAVVGDMVELHCEAERGSPPILYRFYHNNVTLGNSSASSGGGVSFKLSLTAEHSGSYHCTADNGLGAKSSYTMSLNVRVPVSRPVLTLWTPRTQSVVGDLVKLHCEAQNGSLPILYQFYHEDVTLGNNSVLSGRGAFFNLSLTEEHSGNYSCEASNSLGAQLSQVVTLNVKVPVSAPVLILRAPGAQAVVGDMVEFYCEAWRGSPPILYRFYHEDVILGNSSVSFRGGVSFNLSVTIEHSGNYSCEADNGLGAQRSEAVTLSIRGEKSTSDPTRTPSTSDLQEPTYHNVPTWIELQPVYSNVNLKGEDVIYSEVRNSRGKKTCAVPSAPRLLEDQVSLMTCRPSPTSTILSSSPMSSFPLGLLCHLLLGESGINSGVLSCSQIDLHISPLAVSTSNPQHHPWGGKALKWEDLNCSGLLPAALVSSCSHSQSDQNSGPLWTLTYFPTYSPALAVFLSNDTLLSTQGPTRSPGFLRRLWPLFSVLLPYTSQHSSWGGWLLNSNMDVPLSAGGFLNCHHPGEVTEVLCQVGHHTPTETHTLDLLWASPQLDCTSHSPTCLKL
ncbi:Fc receptor-like protein 5 isoform X3 [Elephas maximus indicus]|uniref:Fc receptor-like protein 5 isoform X3 n=1 Tax=Elephas maximus indicus TaxID=99487 RepID=UPI00211643A5|nr:Fc receptor-like protein 5 isoform X3 [Elephas maximus indicus]